MIYLQYRQTATVALLVLLYQSKCPFCATLESVFGDVEITCVLHLQSKSEIRVKTDRGRPRRTKKQRRQDLLPPGPYAQKSAYKRQNQVDSTIKMKNRQDLQRAQQRNRQNEHHNQNSNVTVQQRRQQQQQKQQQQQQQQQNEVPGTLNPQYSLLPGWFAATDPKSNMVYYYNPSTGERTWDWRKAISTAPPGKTLYTPRQTARRDRMAGNGGNLASVQEVGRNIPQRPLMQQQTGYQESPRVGRHIKK